MSKHAVIDCRVVSERMDGLSRYTVELVAHLVGVSSEFEFTLILPNLSAEHPLRLVTAARPIRLVQSEVPWMDPRGHLRIRHLLRGLACDVYHYPHFNLPLAAPGPSVVTIHDLTPLVDVSYFKRAASLKRAYFRAATGHSLWRARAVIVPSTATANAVRASFPWASSKLRVIHEGVDGRFWERPSVERLASFHSRFDIRTPFICYVGVTRPHKNLPRLVRAFARVSDQLPHDLLLSGQAIGDLEGVLRLASELGIGHRVRHLGYLSQEDLRCLYCECTAFALCSLTEGFGLGVLEAMASGAPVVVSDRGAAAEVAGDAALKVDPTSVESIAEGLLAICRDSDRRDSLRAAGRERAAEFTWAAASRRTLDVYREVAK